MAAIIDATAVESSSTDDAPAIDATALAPEKPATSQTRRWILLSFWLVVACLGLPHWIWTTSIHRSDLPLEFMNNWAEGKVYS